MKKIFLSHLHFHDQIMLHNSQTFDGQFTSGLVSVSRLAD